MPTSLQLAGWLEYHLGNQAARGAGALAGPKRETWFSTEFFAAVSAHAGPHPTIPQFHDFGCYGEQNYSTLMKLLQQQAPGTYGSSRPDLVIHDNVAQVDPAAIIEVKLFLNDENQVPELQKLSSQLDAARAVCPQSVVLGVALLAHAPYKSETAFSGAEAAFKASLLTHLPQPHSDWVPGFDVKRVFSAVPTGFAYPAMSVSLSMAVRARL